jgi:hypothetical protein
MNIHTTLRVENIHGTLNTQTYTSVSYKNFHNDYTCNTQIIIVIGIFMA